jgi:hypothetical protein
MQDTLRSSKVADVPFFDQKKVVAILDSATKDGADFGHAVVSDQVLTVALSLVFMHEGLGISS